MLLLGGFSKLLHNIYCVGFLLLLTSIPFPKEELRRSCLEQEILTEIGEQLGLKYGGIFQKVKT